MPERLITAAPSEIARFSAKELKEAIWASEGRVVLAQNYVLLGELVAGVAQPELAVAFGADMIMLNGYFMDSETAHPGLSIAAERASNPKYLRAAEVKGLVGVPVGIYLECPDPQSKVAGNRWTPHQNRVASPENLRRVKDEGADFVVIGGNPGSGTSIERIIATTRIAKEVLGDDVLIFAGKWEDGTIDRVLGDPLASRPAREVIKDLIDAGADVITLPGPGSRQGITVDMIRTLVEFVHQYKPGTLAMVFLDQSVEGADVDTIRLLALDSRKTGADIHAIGDAGPTGIAPPENIYQFSLTIKGRLKTWFRMAVRNR
ncbi:MAG TPA: hypothetical protein VIK82_01410 [Porticoccaceae bacterium]